MGRCWGFCVCVGLLAHGKCVADILYDISMVGVSLGFDGIGWTRFFAVGLCNGKMINGENKRVAGRDTCICDGISD